MECVECYSKCKLVLYCFVPMGCSSRSILMTVSAKSVPYGMSWLTDDTFDTVLLLVADEEFK